MINSNITQDEIKYQQALKRVKKIKGFYSHLLVYIVINSMLLIVNYNNLNDHGNGIEGSSQGARDAAAAHPDLWRARHRQEPQQQLLRALAALFCWGWCAAGARKPLQ